MVNIPESQPGEKEIIPTAYCKTSAEIFSSEAFARCVETYIKDTLKGKGGKRLSALEYARKSLMSDPGEGTTKILRGQEELLSLFSDKKFLDYAQKYLHGIQKFIGTKEDADEFFKSFNLSGLMSFLVTHISNNRARIILSLSNEQELKNAHELFSFAEKHAYRVNGVGRVRFVLTDKQNEILDIYDCVNEKPQEGEGEDVIFFARKGEKVMYVSLTTGEPIGGTFYAVGPIKKEKNKKFFAAQSVKAAFWAKKEKIYLS